MTPQRRGLFATVLALCLVLLVGAGIALAVFMNAKPSSGPRDDGSALANPTQVTVAGDLLDAGTATFGAPRAFWDAANCGGESNPGAGCQIAIVGSASVASDGTFSLTVEIPWYDHVSNPVRPGLHRITICAPTRIPAGFPCASDDFRVLKGTALLSRTSGRPGDAVTISGARWVPEPVDEAIRITWDPSGADIDLRPDEFGPSTWSKTVTIPGEPPGTYTIRICNVNNRSGECVPADTVLKQFTIVPPTVNLNKNSGHSGDAVTVNGSDFFNTRTVRLFFGPKGANLNSPQWQELPPGSSTNSDGNFGPFTFNASGTPGDYTVLACTVPVSISITPSAGCNALDIGTAAYTIVAAPTASPTPKPTASPTAAPTASPTPSASPTLSPTPTPTASPTSSPSPTPSLAPTVAPVSAPPTDAPTAPPTATPTAAATPTPTPTPTAEAVVTWPEHLQSPGQTAAGGGLDLGTLGGMSLLALLIAFLVPFPGTLFNKTVEANYTEIMGWIGGLKRRWTSLVDTVAKGPLGPVRRWLARLLAGRFGVLIFLGMSALVYSFLSPSFGLDTMSLALFLGLVVGLGFITAAFDLPLRIYHGRTSRAHDRGVLRALWWTLLVAVICVVVSRLANFQPGYLYGLIVSIVFVTEISRRDEGVGTWLAALWLLILSFVAWILLAFVRQGAFDPWLSLFLQTVLVTFVVAGIETLAVGLLPMRFLPGHPLFQWRRGMWFVLFALAVMAYLLILVDPANGYLSDDSRTPMLIGVIFLVTFGLVSVGTWAYFRYRPKRALAGEPAD